MKFGAHSSDQHLLSGVSCDFSLSVDHKKLENSSIDGNTRPPNLPPEICMQVKKQQLKPRWNNRLVPNWERSTSRLYIVTLLI